MPLDCVTKLEDDGVPDPLLDTSTLTLNHNNFGLATLSVSVISKDKEFPGLNFCDFDLGGGVKFKGTLDSVTPQMLEFTDYYDYRVVAQGVTE